MKRALICFFIFVAFLVLSINSAEHSNAAQKRGPVRNQMYTAYNIWKHDSLRHMYIINFKSAPTFIPAGTRVSDPRFYEGYPSGNRIIFRIADTGEEIVIQMRPKWHPGKSVWDYYNRMFTTKNFDQLTEGLKKVEIEAIKNGTVVEGMSKRAVLISYGFPPEHKTKSLYSNKWTYWVDTVRQKVICFDEYNRALP